MPLHFSSIPRLLREAAPCIPKPPATQTISHACQTASNSITDHATNMSCIISMLLLLHLIHPSPNSSPPPPPAPLIPAPQTPQTPHLSQPLKYSTMKPHKTAAQMRASRAAVIRSTLQLYLLAAVAWSAPRALLGSLHGARNGTHLSPVTHTAQKSVRAHRNLGEGAGESREQAAEAPDVAC